MSSLQQPSGKARQPGAGGTATSFSEFLRTMPRWKKVAVGGASVAVILGGVLMLLDGGAAPPPATSPGAGPGAGAATLLPEGGGAPQGTGGAGAAPAGEPPWSQAFLGYGFSFFVGFGMGFALRAFLRLVLIFLGVLALSLVGLEHLGFVDIHWDRMDGAFERFFADIGEQSRAFRTFITGSLPNAGLAGLGLFAGFRKNR